MALELIGALVAAAALGLALEQRAAVLVELELRDHDLGRVDADRDGRAVGLLALDALDVDDPLLAVDGRHLALAALERAAHDLHLVVLADRHGLDLSLAFMILIVVDD